MRKGYEVLFYRTYQLFHWISIGHGDGSYRKRLQQITKTIHPGTSYN
ncbi:hypothetical protein [Neochlamydia sp. S13]